MSAMPNMIVLIFVFLISSCEAAAQSLSYLAYKNKSNALFYASWMVYLLIVYLLWKSYHYRGVGYINVIWSGMTTALMLMIGYFFFGERLSKEEWLGTAFIIFGIALMTMHNVKNHLKT